MEQQVFNDDSLEANLENCTFFVEGESFIAWTMYVDRPPPKMPVIPWKQISRGWLIPVDNSSEPKHDWRTYVSFSFAEMWGKLVCFYHPTSSLVDWVDIEGFLDRFWTRDDGSRRKCNLQNFHHCIHACRPTQE